MAAVARLPVLMRFACVPTASGALYSLSNVYMGPINSVHSVTRCDKGSPSRTFENQLTTNLLAVSVFVYRVHKFISTSLSFERAFH